MTPNIASVLQDVFGWVSPVLLNRFWSGSRHLAVLVIVGLDILNTVPCIGADLPIQPFEPALRSERLDRLMQEWDLADKIYCDLRLQDYLQHHPYQPTSSLPLARRECLAFVKGGKELRNQFRLGVGLTDPVVAVLRDRLLYYGPACEDPARSFPSNKMPLCAVGTYFTKPLSRWLSKYQETHDLPITGDLDSLTTEVLNRRFAADYARLQRRYPSFSVAESKSQGEKFSAEKPRPPPAQNNPSPVQEAAPDNSSKEILGPERIGFAGSNVAANLQTVGQLARDAIGLLFKTVLFALLMAVVVFSAMLTPNIASFVDRLFHRGSEGDEDELGLFTGEREPNDTEWMLGLKAELDAQLEEARAIIQAHTTDKHTSKPGKGKP